MKEILVFIDPNNLKATTRCLEQIAADMDGIPVKLGMLGLYLSETLEKTIEFATNLKFDHDFAWTPAQFKEVLETNGGHHYFLDSDVTLGFFQLLNRGLFKDKMVILIDPLVIHELAIHNPKCNAILAFMNTAELEKES
jgi:hypothetical protein